MLLALFAREKSSRSFESERKMGKDRGGEGLSRMIALSRYSNALPAYGKSHDQQRKREKKERKKERKKKITAIAFVPDSVVFRDFVVTRHPLEPRRDIGSVVVG